MRNKRKIICILVVSIALVLILTIFLGYNQSSVIASTYKQELQSLEESFMSLNILEDKFAIIDQIKDKHIAYINDFSFFKNFGEYKKLEAIFSTQIESLTQIIEEDYIALFKDIKITHDDKPNKEDLTKAVDSLNSLLTTLQSDTVLSETSINQLKTDIDQEIDTYKISIKKIETQEESDRLEEELKLAAAKAKAESKAKAEKEKYQSKPNSNTNKPSTEGQTNSGSKLTWKNSKPNHGVISPKGYKIVQFHSYEYYDGITPKFEGWSDAYGYVWGNDWEYIEYLGDWLEQR